MDSVKLVCDNFDSIPDYVKKDLLLFGDSRLNENENKENISYMKSSGRFSGFLFE